jgi:hypothetical protein
MPVSDPSAFPPPRAPDQIVSINAGKNYSGQRAFLAGASCGDNSDVDDIIVIGHDAFSQGVTTASSTGSVVVGSSAMAAFIGNDGRSAYSSVVIGFEACGAMTYGGSNVVIGSQALSNNIGASEGGPSQNVIIGAGACQFLDGIGGDPVNCVAIGYGAMTPVGTGQTPDIGSVVAIGCQALSNLASDGYTAGVVIGTSAGLSVQGTSTEFTLIGNNVMNTSQSVNSVVAVGDAIIAEGAVSQVVAVGHGINAGLLLNTMVGDSIGSALGGQAQSGIRNVIMGAGAGSLAVITNDEFIVETIATSPTVQRSMFYGDMNSGSLIIGNSQTTGAHANRDLAALVANGATNIVKFVDGTPSSTAPTGGGYLYSILGVLHWVNEAGADTVVAGA